jgi:hypothetical protein
MENAFAFTPPPTPLQLNVDATDLSGVAFRLFSLLRHPSLVCATLNVGGWGVGMGSVPVNLSII